MKIILPSDVYPPRCGGAGWSAHALALALRDAGHAVRAVVPREGGVDGWRELDGIAVRDLGYHAPSVPIIRNYYRHERLWPRFAVAVQAAAQGVELPLSDWEQGRADIDKKQLATSNQQREHSELKAIIHAQHIQAVPASVVAGRALGVPVVATVRDHWPWDYFATGLHGDQVPYGLQHVWSLATDLPQRLGPLKGTLALSALPYMLAHMRRRAAYLAACDAVVAVSRYMAARLRPIVPFHKIHVIPNMVDLAATDRLLGQTSQLVPAEPFLLFVGKLERNKGAQLLPAIIAAAQRELPQGHPALRHLVVAGDGPLRALLARELGPLGVRVTFLDWAPHEEVLRLLARCTLLLFPSNWGEPLSRVLLEACAAGAPIVAMPTGGTPDIVAHGTSGLLAATPAAFGRYVAELLADEPRRCALGSGARARAEAYFAAPVVVGRFEALYKQTAA